MMMGTQMVSGWMVRGGAGEAVVVDMARKDYAARCQKIRVIVSMPGR